MQSDDLTSVERSALFLLMAEARPLRESAEMRVRFGVSLRRQNRIKLQALGLISTTTAPLTHTLTDRGWQWIEGEARRGSRPPGQANIGALYAVASALGHVANRSRLPLQRLLDPKIRLHTSNSSRAARPAEESEAPAPPAEPHWLDPISEAAWSSADESLALALQDMSKLDKAFARLRAALGDDKEDAVRRTELAVGLVTQWIRQAARKRWISIASPPGEEIGFDPVAYLSEEPLEVGDRARVVQPAIIRGEGSASIVIARGEVEGANELSTVD